MRVFKSSDICWGAVKMLCAGGGDSGGDGRGGCVLPKTKHVQ